MPYVYGDYSLYKEGDILNFYKSKWIARLGLAQGALVAGAANAFTFNWQNPKATKLLISRVLIYITVRSVTVGSLLDVGVASGSGVHSDNLINGADLNAVAPVVYDNFADYGVNGKFKQICDENGGANAWVTGQILVQPAAALVGKFFIECIEIIT